MDWKTGSQAIDVLNEIGLELLRYRVMVKTKWETYFVKW